MKEDIVEEMEDIVGSDFVIGDIEQIKDYLIDETPEPVRPNPEKNVIVVKPEDVDEISKIMDYASHEGVNVVPRGAGTGLCGAAVPTEPSILLSMERLDEILEVDEDNFTVTCQAGVTLEKLFDRLDETGSLFFPPHPGDEGAQVGGLAVENAGGARAVKYGVLRNYVKGMEVVLPSGETIKLGGKVLKNNSGLPLLHLMIGSEGILGIVGKVTLRLYPKPRKMVSLIVPYNDRHEAMSTVPKILQRGLMPLAAEYMERDLIEKSAKHIGEEWPSDEGRAYLYIIVTGGEEEVYSQCERIGDICSENGALDILIADRRKDQEKILKIRSNIYTALEPESADILDVTVPPSDLEELMNEVETIAEKFGVRIPSYGHVADGNLHPHILKRDDEGPKNMDEIKKEIYEKALDLGGVITGEHGIGKTRVRNLPQALGKTQINLMRGIKKVFDPNGILNPGTILDSNDD